MVAHLVIRGSWPAETTLQAAAYHRPLQQLLDTPHSYDDVDSLRLYLRLIAR